MGCVKYFEEAKALWKAYVPPQGQAATVQGELIRAVEKLRDEAQRNGNVNWDEGHKILADFLRDTLLACEVFDQEARREIHGDAARLLDFEHPETTDEPFDRLTDRIVEWSRAHPDPLPHRRNPKLRR
jgi:hypothetical protein